jgi:hypothetical protein
MVAIETCVVKRMRELVCADSGQSNTLIGPGEKVSPAVIGLRCFCRFSK